MAFDYFSEHLFKLSCQIWAFYFYLPNPYHTIIAMGIQCRKLLALDVQKTSKQTVTCKALLLFLSQGYEK